MVVVVVAVIIIIIVAFIFDLQNRFQQPDAFDNLLSKTNLEKQSENNKT